MRGHSDICLHAYCSISDTSVGLSCIDTGRKENPCFIIENSFFLFIENDNSASQESGNLEWRKCQDKFSFVLLLISIWILYARWALFNSQDQGHFERGGKQHRCTGQWIIRYNSINDWFCLSLQEGLLFSFFSVPIFWSCCVIIRSRDWTPRLWLQLNLINYCSKYTISFPPAVFF